MKLYHAILLFSLFLITGIFAAPSIQDLKNGEWEFCGPDTLEAYQALYISGDTIIVPQAEPFTSSNWIYRSIDKGETWERSDSLVDLESVYFIIAWGGVHWCGGQGAYAIHRSDDGGLTWNKQYNNKEKTDYISGVYNHVVHDSIMVLCSYGNIYRSTNYGDTWEKSCKLSGSAIIGITKFDTTLFVASYAGLYKSNDFGVTWDRCRATGLYSSLLLDCDFIDSTLYVSAYGGAYESHDFGETFTRIYRSNNSGVPLYLFPTYGNHMYMTHNRRELFEYDPVNGITFFDDSISLENRINNIILTDEYMYITTYKGLFRQTLGETTISDVSNSIKRESSNIRPTVHGILISLNSKKRISLGIYSLRGQLINRVEKSLSSGETVLDIKSDFSLVAGRYIVIVEIPGKSFQAIPVVIE